jgi:hypothetical protein
MISMGTCCSIAYIFAPTGELWPAASVNARIPPITVGDKPVTATAWLDHNKPVEQMTWAPSEPQIITGRMISHGGWIPRPKHTVFNLYRPPLIEPGNAAEADRWLDHIHKIYPDDASHIVKWLAQRVQRPQEKINHALCSAAIKVSARIPCSSPSSALSVPGISKKYRHSNCSVVSMAI